ncbi:ATP-binding protein [Clostridium transplantifaecale]|uniref:sensor histidine kinase n=1 Tax=Clostridium transplantifaecale TaxID=2479838 RepID=UPI000F635E45|nr:ATP-binding protein [Clostridium transplantifaecale]
MKRFLFMFVLIMTVCVTLLFTASQPFVSEGPAASKGVMDLRETDFTSDVYALSGEWEFYYGCLYTPDDLGQGKEVEAEYISLPGPWLKLGYPRLGYATYRLHIETATDDALLLYVPEIMSSSVIWVNGRELFEAGRPGSSAEHTVPGVRNDLLAVVPMDGTLDLVIQAANYHMNGSGLFYPLLIGRDTVLTHHIFRQRILVAAALGGIFFIGIYHLFLFAFRRRERIYLIYSVTCLVTTMRLAMESNNLVQYFLPGGIGPVLNRVFLLLFTLQNLCICLFMLQLFSIRLGRVLRVVYGAAFILPMIFIIIQSVPYAVAVNWMFLVLVPFCISVLLVVKNRKIGRDPYRLLYFISLIIFIFFGPLSKTVFEGELFVPGIVPNMFLLLSQCLMLSRNYAKAHNEVERVNENLELLVEQRTEQLHNANKQLAASQAALREMIANISHDLKTPLTVLNNYLELLGDGTVAANEQERAEYLGIAYHKNLDLQRLIHNLFEVTRMEGGTAVYRKESISAARLMQEAEHKYCELVQDNGIHFSAESEDGLELNVDGNKIWSVLDNLVYNAIRYTPEGGSISLRVRKTGGGTELTVSDTGEGIAPEHLPHIFERFYKVSPERGEKDGSSGLGLYIVKTVVEAMGGTVRAESAQGKGTVFTIRF